MRVHGQSELSVFPVRPRCAHNPDDMRAAQAVATQIEADIRTGNFDPSLEKYGHTAKIQNKLDRANESLKEMRDKQQGMGLWALWQRYCKFKQRLVAPSTFRVDFGRRMNWLNGREWTIGDAVEVRDWVIAHKPPKQARRILNLLAAACRWGMESGLVETNPFEGMTLPHIEYRNPKQTRHTFITERILGGDSPANL